MLSESLFRIEQIVDGDTHWCVIKLVDRTEKKDGSQVTGRWESTSQSYSGKLIIFTSDNPEYYYWEWNGGPQGGDITVGSKMAVASHKQGEDSFFQVLITLDFAKRTSNGKFRVGSVLKNGSGKLTYKVGNDFTKGDITWTIFDDE